MTVVVVTLTGVRITVTGVGAARTGVGTTATVVGVAPTGVGITATVVGAAPTGVGITATVVGAAPTESESRRRSSGRTDGSRNHGDGRRSRTDGSRNHGDGGRSRTDGSRNHGDGRRNRTDGSRITATVVGAAPTGVGSQRRSSEPHDGSRNHSDGRRSRADGVGITATVVGAAPTGVGMTARSSEPHRRESGSRRLESEPRRRRDLLDRPPPTRRSHPSCSTRPGLLQIHRRPRSLGQRGDPQHRPVSRPERQDVGRNPQGSPSSSAVNGRRSSSMMNDQRIDRDSASRGRSGSAGRTGSSSHSRALRAAPGTRCLPAPGPGLRPARRGEPGGPRPRSRSRNGRPARRGA